MTEEQKSKIIEEFYELASSLAEAGKWDTEHQEILDDLTTGCDPQECLEDLRKKSED